MDYIIVTRYNIQLYDRFDEFNTTNDWGFRSVEEYWRHRIRICRKTLYRSLKQQTDRNFQWILWLDPHTPTHHMRHLENNFGDIATLTIGSKANRVIDRRCVVTKIDNDDMLDKDYVRDTRTIAETLDGTSLIEPKQVFHVAEDLTRWRYEPTPAYIRQKKPGYASSIYTHVSDSYTMIHSHVVIASTVDKIVNANTYALCYVHETNRCFRSNNMKPITPEIYQILKGRFGLDAKLPRTNK